MTEPNTIVPVPKPSDRASARPARFIILLACFLCLAVSLTFPFPTEARHWGALFDLAHAPAFFVVFLLFAGIMDPAVIGLKRQLKPLVSLNVSRLALLSLALCVVGVIGELAQGLVSRSPSLLDALANCSGLLAAMFWCASRRIQTRSARWMLAMIAPALVVVPGISSFQELRECILQRNEFPLLASFERSQELNAWYPHQALVGFTSEWSSRGAQSMRIHGKKLKRFPGASMIWPINDWTEYSQFQLDVHNPQDTNLPVGIRISDSDHAATGHEPSDRYQTSFLIAASSTQTIAIELNDVASAPATREMAMNRIALVDIFMPEANADTTVFVDNLRLTK